MKKSLICIFVLIMASFCADAAGGSVVNVGKDTEGVWRLYVNGEAFYANGAASNRKQFHKDIVKAGGNALRLYSASAKDCREVMDSAYANGMMVHLGLGMAQARRMDYRDTAAVEAMKGRILERVRQFRDHPALLCWSIGNEVEIERENDTLMWKAMGDLADKVKALDPGHPVSVTLSGSSADKLRKLASCSDAFDIISINAYYPHVGKIDEDFREAGYDRPYMVTEYGPRGTWDMADEPSRILPWTDYFRGKGMALVEETSTEKEEIYRRIWQEDIKGREKDGCVGSFVFVWGYQGHGEVLSWYGMFTKDGYAFGCYDAMQYCWSGKYPEMRAPRIESRGDMTMNGRRAEDAVRVAPGSVNSAKVVAMSPCGNPLRYHWFIYKEGGKMPNGTIPDAGISGLIRKDGRASVRFGAPSDPGSYRLYVFVYDDRSRKVASSCIPFRVE